MSAPWLERLGERVAEAANPIVVKEVRQGLRTRSFWVFFSLLLVLCLTISLVFFAQAAGGSAEGKGAFVGYFLCLALVQFFVIPYSAFRSMAREREEETWVLLTLTGLGPRRILLGKLGSAVLQGLLYASAAAPFLVFSYQLNGVDLPTILVAMLGSVAYQVFLVAVGVSFATLAEGRLLRSVMNFVVLGVLLNALFAAMGMAAALAEGVGRLGSSRQTWLTLAAVAFGFVSTGLLLFEAAAARLALVTEDYARGPRLAFLFQLTGLVGVLTLVWALDLDGEAAEVGAVVSGAYLLVVGGLVTTDRDGMAPRHRASSATAWLLRPGAARALLLVWAGVLVAGGLFAALALGSKPPTGHGHSLALALGVPAFVLLYLGAAHLLGRSVKVPASERPVMVRVVLVALLVVGSGLPPLVGAGLSKAEDPFLNLLNPVVGLINLATDGEPLMVAVPWVAALLVSVAAWRLVWRQDREAGA